MMRHTAHKSCKNALAVYVDVNENNYAIMQSDLMLMVVK